MSQQFGSPVSSKSNGATKNAATELELVKAQLALAQAQVELLKASKGKSNVPVKAFGLKIGDKGGIVITGLSNSRFPVTLYVSQWEKLLAHVEEIDAFAKAHGAELKRKEAASGE